MNYLADTNIFLEILLNQSKTESCKSFLKAGTLQTYKLDFDDAYQLGVASEFELTVKTMDLGFEKVKAVIPVEFQ